MGIKEFLLTRIAEDEAAADVLPGETLGCVECGFIDGRRILAERAAKRAIMDVVTRWEHSYMDEDMWYSCPLAVAPGEAEVGSGYSGDDEAVCRCGLEDRQMRLLLPLAAIYFDHADYQQDWAL